MTAVPVLAYNKYGNKPTHIDNLRFASKKEANRYLYLKYRAMTGEITDLRMQVRFKIVVNGKKICDYIADFVYIENGREIVEDTKGKLTDVYKLKAKLMEACLGIVINEV